MSLKFLSKKKFHTTNLENVEQVWLKEQEQLAEERKTLELKRQIAEEREYERVQELQEKSGLIKRSFKQRSKLAWMYQGPAASNLANREDYLDGKKSAGDLLDKQEVKYSDKPKYEVSDNSSSISIDQNEQFRRLHQDPLFAIKRAQKQRIDRVKSNPILMRKAKERTIQKLQDKLKNTSQRSTYRLEDVSERRKHRSSKRHRSRITNRGSESRHGHRRRRRRKRS